MQATGTRAQLLAAAKSRVSDLQPDVPAPDVSSRSYHALLAILCALDDLGYADPVQITDVRDALQLERLIELSVAPEVSLESRILIKQYLSLAQIHQATPRSVRTHVPVQVYVTQLMAVASSRISSSSQVSAKE